MTTNDSSRTLQDRLIARLAEWMKISITAAEQTFKDTMTAKSLADGTCNLRYQTEEYVFSCLKDELMADDSATMILSGRKRLPRAVSCEVINLIQ